MSRRGNKTLFFWRSAQSCKLTILASVLGLVVFVTLLYSLCNWENPAVDGITYAYATKKLNVQVLPVPTVGFIMETEVIWQIPSDPRAVLFIAHECGGSALNFWDKCASCPNCLGLPEEKQIVLDALAQKFAVIVITSSDVCWSYGKDGLKVKEILRWWLRKHGLVKSPLFGLGASSGGYFLSVLATKVKFRGIVLMIASGLFDRMNSIPEDYPPTLFVHMPKDVRRRQKVDKHIQMLRKKGIEAQEIMCMEFAVTPNWLAARISALDQTTSLKLFKLFQVKGFIDAKGYMKYDVLEPTMFTRREESHSLWRSTHSCQSCNVVAILGLVIFVTLLFVPCSRESSSIDETTLAHATPKLGFQVLPNPTVGYVKDTEVIWQIPSHSKAVLFIAHGCGGTALNFWDPCPECLNCVGLPEEKQIVHDAIAQRFAILVITKTEECWSYEKDGLKVEEILKWWLEKHALVKHPFVGLGASSGGDFLSVLATKITFSSIVVMIASTRFDKMESIPNDYPPTLFVHMPKDERTKKKIDTQVEMLKKKGIKVQEIKCMEFPVTANWLSDRVPSLDPATSSKLIRLFRDKGFTDTKGYMKYDGRVAPWREAIKQNNIVLPNGSKFMHHVEEELNLAYAYHEMTSLQSDQIFEWFKSHL
ncbi:Poly(3-hydroxyoctanoate) depolymerase [Bienertia sinuspersici]